MTPSVLLDARMALRGLGIATFVDRLMMGFADADAPAPALWRGTGAWDRSGLVSTLLHSGLFDVSPRLDPRTRHYDAVHFAGNVGSLRPGPHSVITVHDLMHRRALRTRARVLGAFLEHSVVRAGQVVAVSARTREELEHAFPSLAGRVVVIPHGMRARRAPDGPRAHVLAFGGASDPRKRTDLAIAVYREYQATTAGAVPLVVLGRAGLTATQRGELERMGARVVDNASGTEVDELMLAAAALLYTTTEEGFGLPVLEAAEASTPVVIDETADIANEVVGAHCFQVADSSLASWVAQLRRAVAAGPVDAGLQLPDWRDVAGAYRALYERVSGG